MESQSSMRHFWLDRSVLITGVNGFIGSWLADRLADLNARVVGISRSGTSSWDHDGQIEIVRGTIDDADFLYRTIRDHKIDAVFHLAAQPLVTAAEEGPVETFDTNIRGTWNLLEACRRNQRSVSRIVVASSEQTYGKAVVESLDESSPLGATSPYAVSKICADLIARSYFATFQLPVCIARYGNVYGGRDLNFDRIIPGTIRSLHAEQQPVIRSDGKAVRDYLAVHDLVDGYLRLAEKMSDSSILGEIFNFNSQQRLSVLEITQLIVQLMNRADLQPVVMGFSRGETLDRVISSRKATSTLGWEPRISLEEGLLEAINWYNRHLACETIEPPHAEERVLSD